jgi:hypothetical protein
MRTFLIVVLFSLAGTGCHGAGETEPPEGYLDACDENDTDSEVCRPGLVCSPPPDVLDHGLCTVQCTSDEQCPDRGCSYGRCDGGYCSLTLCN